MITAMVNSSMSGPYNCVAPQLVTNKTLTFVLAKSLYRPALFWVPEFVVKSLFGERSYLILQGRKIIPERLIKEIQYQFKFTDLEVAIRNVISNDTK